LFVDNPIISTLLDSTHTTHPRDLANWNLGTMRAAWGWLPEWNEVRK